MVTQDGIDFDLPDSARVWRPPVETVAILTPGPRDTIEGDAVKNSSQDEEFS